VTGATILPAGTSAVFVSAAASVALEVDGVVHRGWHSVTVAHGMERLAAAFRIELTEARDDGSAPRRIRPGAACALSFEGEPVILGHVDQLGVDYDARTRRVTVVGRDLTGDLVDCAATTDGPFEWAGLTLPEAADRVCRPFALSVRSDVPPGAAFPRFALQPGETGHEALERAARQRAVLLMSDRVGHLVLTRAGAGGPAAGAIVLGANVLQASSSFDHSQRFDRVTVRGQAEGSVEAAQGIARARDADVRRHRPKVLLAEAAGDGPSLQERADWEVQVARGKGRRVRYTVPGWRGATGRLWEPNTLVEVTDAELGLDRAELLVVEVELSCGADGTKARLELAPADAYARLPEGPGKGGAGGSGRSLWEDVK
jgi:prophage tail gpP-like protein